MAILQTVATKEDFLVQVNGDYNVPYDQVSVTAAGASGDVIAVGSKLGILAEAKGTGAKVVRVLVRGNPTTVNAKALNFGVLVVKDTVALLAAQGILVVNQ